MSQDIWDLDGNKGGGNGTGCWGSRRLHSVGGVRAGMTELHGIL